MKNFILSLATLTTVANASAQTEPTNWVQNPMPVMTVVDTQIVCKYVVIEHNPFGVILESGEQKPRLSIEQKQNSGVKHTLSAKGVFRLTGYAPEGFCPFIYHKVCGEFMEEYDAVHWELYNSHDMPSGLNLEFKSLSLETEGDVTIKIP